MLSLGTAVALSPELLLVGLWLSSSQVGGRKKAWAYFFGGVVGYFSLLTIGFFVGPAQVSHPSWAHFYVRVSVAAILIFLGLRALFKKAKTDEADKKHHSATNIGPFLSLLIGVAIIVVNIKLLALTVAAGGRLAGFTGPKIVALEALAVFLALGLFPMIIPAAVESARTGLSNLIMGPCRRFFDRFGKWIIAVICFVLAAQLINHALQLMP